MKESTLITNFNQLNNKYNKLIELTQQNLRQVYMIQTATSMTIEALTNLLVEKALISHNDIKTYIEKEQQKRVDKSSQSKEEQLKAQPVFDTNTEIPVAQGEE